MATGNINEEPKKWTPSMSERWDRFDEKVEERILSEDHVFWDKCYRATKVVFSGFLFILVLCSTVVSKSCLLILTWNIFTPINSTTRTELKTLGGHFTYIRNSTNELLNPDDAETNVSYIWALFLMVVTPYIFTVLFSVWRFLFRKSTGIKYCPLFLAVILASLHSVGLSIFVFVLLPSMDPLSGLWYCSNVTLVPSVVHFIFSDKKLRKSGSPIRLKLSFVCKMLAILFSVISVVFWGIYVGSDTSVSGTKVMLFVLSPILVSLGWWESFLPEKLQVNNTEESESGNNNAATEREREANQTDGEHSNTSDKPACLVTVWNLLHELKFQNSEGKYKVYAVVNMSKIIVTFLLVIIIYSTSCQTGGSFNCTDVLFGIYETPARHDSDALGSTWLILGDMCEHDTPFLVAVVGILTSLICHRLSVAAIKSVAQKQSFSMPMVLTSPMTFGALLILFTQLKDGNHICTLPFPWWQEGGTFPNLVYLIIACVTGYLSLLFLTSHVWTIETERMEKESRIFVKPLYCGCFFDQSLLLNKVKEIKIHHKANPTQQSDRPDSTTTNQREPVPKIYLCATMWHETEVEMTQLLKSLFRMDIDQCARTIYAGGTHHYDFYKFEAHVFFDDAFVEGSNIANEYVKTFITVTEETARSTYPRQISLRHPKKRRTPYGGRLTWILPGENKLVCHLKDKLKIRRKKRWSQVMYMYYFLSHKLDVKIKDIEKQKERAKNIYLLALDGDVDFRPSAVKLLIDRMKRNPEVGAACGRIHPIGSGPMVWYQKFEYAVSHWLVKSAEHVSGCVLCSPGCFSLFRGSALMDCNVMRRYTALPTQAVHHLQYDQGEDRWLCTLLLKQGYKVDYCAASDAYTFAPEGFKEFYNQRRRWSPSTMANILDILGDWKVVTKRNNNVSLPYIALQMSWFISGILTPGVLFLMIVGAINLAYPNLSLHATLIINLTPVVLFVLTCFFARTEYQLNLAAALSILYSLVMMVVLIGLVREAADEGLCSIITLFILFVSGVFVIAGIIHPKETGCLFHGFLFFIAIPSMSMLLVIYSILNLNNVSWGTREAPKIGKPGTNTSKGGKKNVVQNVFDKMRVNCSCCQAPESDKNELVQYKLDEVMSKLDAVETGHQDLTKNEQDDSDPESSQAVPEENLVSRHERYLNYDPKTSKTIPENEELFWNWLIHTYLSPGEKAERTEESEEQRLKEEKLKKKELKELRNKASLAFLLLNAIFITIIFYLQQLNEDTGGQLSIEITCMGGNLIQVEPISMAFTVVFGILLVTQFTCMIVHRWKTFLQINSITKITQDFDVDQLFLDVVNEILEKKKEKEATLLKKPHPSTDKGRMRLKQFIEKKLLKQRDFAGSLLENRESVRSTETGSAAGMASFRSTTEVANARSFRTLAQTLGRLNSSRRLRLSENLSFRETFLSRNQVTPIDMRNGNLVQDGAVAGTSSDPDNVTVIAPREQESSLDSEFHPGPPRIAFVENGLIHNTDV